MSDLPVLRRLQRLWVVFVVVVVGILAALPLVDVEPSELPLALSATLAAAGGVGAFIAIVAIDLTFAASPPSDDVRALQEYEARKTLAFAVAQAPAVLGFALTFAFGQLLPAAIGGVAAAACLIRARPSLGGLRRLDAAWSGAGRHVSALRAAERGRDGTQPQGPSTPDTQVRNGRPGNDDEAPDEATGDEGAHAQAGHEGAHDQAGDADPSDLEARRDRADTRSDDHH